MRWYMAGLVAVAVLSCAGPARSGQAAAQRPRLDLRAMPRVAFSPVEVFLVGELRGGQDNEEFYCPALVWDWGDGSRSTRESDCSPYQDGMHLERFFSARHAFRDPGSYNVRLFLVRAGRTLTVAAVPIAVYGHVGDSSGN
jgi:hypothetical protein